MLNQASIYQSALPKINENMIVIRPHPLLRPYIANYTFTDPSTMPHQQTILPTISSTLVCTFQNGHFTAGLRGVNTKPTAIANYARQFDFMFLIEFHAAGFYPFLKIDQHYLADDGFLFSELDSILYKQIAEKSLSCNGTIRVKDLANETFYSEKQMNRLFRKYAGAKVKTCSRIIRMKKAVELLNTESNIGLLFERTGHHDYAHFVHDFRAIYGITPKEYLEKMSLFYNDPYKL